ncbi:MAG: NAD(P)/FAD-dependent oxidoreductase [Actinobacteria bacterium]|nr:NAD(P)/FAD-dependent oxidoreductase [Actinomycetota bacterium]
MTTGHDVVVIGGGHNGLVAGAYLARAGKKVLILERAGEVGGILRGGELAPGFVAPGIAHTVGRLRRSVIADLKLERHGFRAIEPDVRVFAPQPDGRAITFWADAGRTAEEIRALSAKDADAYVAFDRKVRVLASFVAHIDAATPPDVKVPSIADAIAGLKLGKAFRDLGAKAGRETIRALPMAVADFVGENFEEEAVRGPLAARGVLYTNVGPWAAGTAAVYLSDSAGSDGGAPGQSTFAEGGTAELARVLRRAAESFGAQVRTGAEVMELLTRDGRVVGVRTATGETIEARAVVSTADPKRTLRLVDPEVLGPHMVWRAGNIRQPGATAKVDLALGGLPAFTGADEDRLRGRIVIAPSIDHAERAKDASKYGQVAEEPWLEATIPSLTDPSLAPDGKHVMSVLFEAAPRHLRDGDWSSERERVGDVAVRTLERYAPGLGELIEARRVITPEDLETEYALTGGHVYHAEPGLDQFFAWRPLNGHARYRFVVDGLYLAGSGAHPGGGITGGPAANAARAILKDL